MKLTTEILKRMIKEELSSLGESKEEHMRGIADKIARLEQAKENAERGMENMLQGAMSVDDEMEIKSNNAYYAKQVEVMNLHSKITLLLKQLQQLQQDSPGELVRPSE
tara:strand:- start:3934 stop:4257 length:324 start_codon:yes stop_codon:yes gene_type:complete